MSSSRYTTKRMTFQEVKNEEEFRYFLTHDFNFNQDAFLFHDERFVTMLLNSPNIFRDFSYTHFIDNTIPSLLFSKENVPIIKSIDEHKLSQTLSYIMNLDNCYSTFLQEYNYYLLENSNINVHSFTAPLLEYAYENNDRVANEFIKNHPEYIVNHRLYSKIKVSTPITSDELEAIAKIKEYLNISDEESFYCKFSIDTINSLVDSGYYSFLSNKDKRNIINNNIIYHNSDEKPLSIKLFQNKDFFTQLCNVTRLDAVEVVKTLNYIKMYHPETYETYDSLFKGIIKDKKVKDINDISYLCFDDYFDNVKLNIELILDYARSNEAYKAKLDYSKLDILSHLDFNNIKTPNDVINLYEKLKEDNINYADLIYDYVSLARDNFSSDLKESLSSLNESDGTKVYEGVNIHYYDGKPLSFVVHCSMSKRGTPEEFASNRVKALEKGSSISKFLSTSYINDNNLNVYDNESIIYGFNDLSSMNLISAHYEDAFTSNNLDFPINRPSTYRSLEDFSNHPGYSELVFKSDKIKPNFIVCFDKFDDYDLETARRLNIDIVCINTKKYVKAKESKSSDIKNKKYINY